MPNEITFQILSLEDVLSLKEIKVYQYQDAVILTTVENGKERILHLYENQIDGRDIYGMNKGDEIHFDTSPIFYGQPSSLETSYIKNERDWDFQSLTISGINNISRKITRNNASFPEPTFVISS